MSCAAPFPRRGLRTRDRECARNAGGIDDGRSTEDVLEMRGMGMGAEEGRASGWSMDFEIPLGRLAIVDACTKGDFRQAPLVMIIVHFSTRRPEPECARHVHL